MRASFSATGAYLALVEEDSLKVFETESMACVTKIEEIEELDRRAGMQWGLHGTIGTVMVWLNSDDHGELDLSLLHGTLVGTAQCPLTHFMDLTRTVIPLDAVCEVVKLSPDLSKLCVAETYRGNNAVSIMVFDTSSGVKIWMQGLRSLQVAALQDYHPVCQEVLWHPDRTTLLFESHQEFHPHGGPCGHAHLIAASLSSGVVHHCNLGPPVSTEPDLGPVMNAYNLHVSSDGAFFGAHLQYERVTEQIILQWPSMHVVWKGPAFKLHWDWCGTRLACVQKAPAEVHNGGLRLSVPDISSVRAHDSWLPGPSCDFCDFLRHRWPDADPTRCFLLHLAWSPSGEFLAFHVRQPVPPCDLSQLQACIIVVHSLEPGLPVVSRFYPEPGFRVDSLRWSPNSAVLCATGLMGCQGYNLSVAEPPKQGLYVFDFSSSL